MFALPLICWNNGIISLVAASRLISLRQAAVNRFWDLPEFKAKTVGSLSHQNKTVQPLRSWAQALRAIKMVKHSNWLMGKLHLDTDWSQESWKKRWGGQNPPPPTRQASVNTSLDGIDLDLMKPLYNGKNLENH